MAPPEPPATKAIHHQHFDPAFRQEAVELGKRIGIAPSTTSPGLIEPLSHPPFWQ